MGNKDTKSRFKGIFTYERDDEKSFFGRYDETAELVDKIKNNRLTILYGQSGTGKSSLIQAGIIPALCDDMVDDENEIIYSPIRICLSSKASQGYEDQIVAKIVDEFEWLELPSDFNSGLECLLFRFEKNVVPVIILDQFEELYYDCGPLAVEKKNVLLSCINRLILENEDDFCLFRVLISFREDYLSFIEDDTAIMPPLNLNRYRLQSLTVEDGVNIVKSILVAIEPPLADGEESEKIAEYMVSRLCGLKNEERSNHNSDKLDIMALSLYGFLIDVLRKEEGREKFSVALIEKENPEKLVNKYYQDCIDKVSEASRDFIENELIEDNHKKRKGISKSDLLYGDLEMLADKGILRKPNPDEAVYEISHDKVLNVIQNEKVKRLSRRELWSDYINLFPFFFLLAFFAYFLLNAIMGDMTLLCFDDNLSLEIKVYKDRSITGWQSSPISHVLGNVILLLLSFTIPNTANLYLKFKTGRKFIIYCLGSVLLTISLFYMWHEPFYINFHDVFFHSNRSNVLLIWKILFAVIAVVNSVFMLLTINKFNHRESCSWQDIFTMQPFIKNSAVKTYLIVILFVCLLGCVIPYYNNAGVNSEAGIVLVYLIGILAFSLFFPNGKIKNFAGPFTFLCAVLFLTDLSKSSPMSYWINICGYKFELDDILGSDILITFVFIAYIIFLLYRVGWVKNDVHRVVLNSVIVIVAIVIYIGYFPLCNGFITPNVRKWKWTITKRDSGYTVNMSSGAAILPDLDFNEGLMIAISSDSVFYRNEIDSFIMNYNTTRKPLNDGIIVPFKIIEPNGSVSGYNLAINPNLLYWPHNQNPRMDTELHQLSVSVFDKTLSRFLTDLKSGVPLDDVAVGANDLHLKEQMATEASKDTILHRIQDKTLTTSFMSDYIAALARELSTALLIETSNSRSFLTTRYAMCSFYNTHFYNCINEDPAANYTYTQQFLIESLDNKNKWSESVSFNAQQLSDVQLPATYQLLKAVLGNIRLFLLPTYYKPLERLREMVEYLNLHKKSISDLSENKLSADILNIFAMTNYHYPSIIKSINNGLDQIDNICNCFGNEDVRSDIYRSVLNSMQADLISLLLYTRDENVSYSKIIEKLNSLKDETLGRDSVKYELPLRHAELQKELIDIAKRKQRDH